MQQSLPEETDEIGYLLQREYGLKDPNTHIQYFYIRLGKKFFKRQVEIIETLKRITGKPEIVKIKPGWDGIVFFESQEEGNERDHEKSIDEKIRSYLLKVSDPSLHMMFSRACLYKKTRRYGKITTDEIGGIMDSKYGDKQDTDPGNTHIEYFYLFVQAIIGEESFLEKQIGDKDICIHAMAFDVLKTLPGDWKSVEPQKTWQGTFFGLFEKETPGMTEREREKLLNGEVRIPLIKKLEDKLARVPERDGLKPKVQVIITRACKYTPTKMET